MSRRRLATAEAWFGSVVRGDMDQMSDRDILIVDDNPAILLERTRELEAEGWSVASYTFAKLGALASKGALFVQHLKLESEIINDVGGRLAAILRSFEPRKSYVQELNENARLANLAGSIPIAPRGELLATDILYVAVRNFGVMQLAQRGIHLYSYGSILQALENQGILASNGVRALSVLRSFKCLYRARKEHPTDRTLSSINIALEYLPKDYFPAKVELRTPFIILAGLPPEDPAPTYLVLRDLEKRMVAMSAILEDSFAEGELARLSSWIANPRAYASLAGKAAPEIRAAISDRVHHFLARGAQKRVAA